MRAAVLRLVFGGSWTSEVNKDATNAAQLVFFLFVFLLIETFSQDFTHTAWFLSKISCIFTCVSGPRPPPKGQPRYLGCKIVGTFKNKRETI